MWVVDTFCPTPPLLGKQSSSLYTHIDGVPLKDAELQEQLQLDLPLLEELLHLALGLVQLLQHALDVRHGAVVRGLVAGDGRVSAETRRLNTT